MEYESKATTDETPGSLGFTLDTIGKEQRKYPDITNINDVAREISREGRRGKAKAGYGAIGCIILSLVDLVSGYNMIDSIKAYGLDPFSINLIALTITDTIAVLGLWRFSGEGDRDIAIANSRLNALAEIKSKFIFSLVERPVEQTTVEVPSEAGVATS